MRKLWFSTSSSLGFLTAVYYKINSACRPKLAEDLLEQDLMMRTSGSRLPSRTLGLAQLPSTTRA